MRDHQHFNPSPHPDGLPGQLCTGRLNEAGYSYTSSLLEPEPSKMGILAGILTALDRVWTVFSSHELRHTLQEQLCQGTDEINLGNQTQLALEQFLNLAQKLAMSYVHTYNTALPSPQDAHGGDAFVDGQYSTEGMSGQRLATNYSKMDLAMMYALMACHVRVLDVIDAIVKFARACADMAPFLPPGYDPKFDVPDIRIGTFLAPRAAAASIFLTTLLELQIELIGKAQDLRQRVKDRCHPEQDAPKELELAGLQCQLLVDRATGRLEDSRNLKTHVLNVGILRMSSLQRD